MFEDEIRRLAVSGDLLVIAGTGLSLNVTGSDPRASWQGLLHRGVEYCERLRRCTPAWANRRHGDIGDGDLDEMIGAAELIGRKLGAPRGGDFRSYLRDSVSILKAKDPAAIRALRDLGVPIATTNYDSLLEQETGRRPVSWRDQNRVGRTLRGYEDAIIHLHGYWEEPESVVFGVRSYEEVTRDAHAQAVLKMLPLRYSILFVGCGEGLADPNFGELVRWMRTHLAETEARHYLLAPESKMSELVSSYPPAGRILPTCYGSDYPALADYLERLVP